jgi:hypothetical protein
MPSPRHPVAAFGRPWFVIAALLSGPASVRLPAQALPNVLSMPAQDEEDEGLRRGALPPATIGTAAHRSAARGSGGFTASFGPYTRHTGKGIYNSKPKLRGLEWETGDRWTIGALTFKNSFWQPCWFAFGGRRMTFNGGNDGWFVKIVAGVIHGYKAPWANAVSLNYRANCPAVIPSVGCKFRHVTVQLVVFGVNAGQMPIISHDLR